MRLGLVVGLLSALLWISHPVRADVPCVGRIIGGEAAGPSGQGAPVAPDPCDAAVAAKNTPPCAHTIDPHFSNGFYRVSWSPIINCNGYIPQHGDHGALQVDGHSRDARQDRGAAISRLQLPYEHVRPDLSPYGGYYDCDPTLGEMTVVRFRGRAWSNWGDSGWYEEAQPCN